MAAISVDKDKVNIEFSHIFFSTFLLLLCWVSQYTVMLIELGKQQSTMKMECEIQSGVKYAFEF